ncbi:MAG: D-aminoacyl-tRNA deacylase [Bacteroidota bacterium]
MRALIQRVSSGRVSIGGREHAAIGGGMVILLGVAGGDTREGASRLAARCASLRIFADEAGKMNLSVQDAGGSMLVVSQFTLYADTQGGNRPGFPDAARPEEADELYRAFVSSCRLLLGPERVQTGVFGAAMEVDIRNDGPVTIMLESR